MFGLDLHSWEAVMVGSLALAAIAAIAIVASTRVVIVLQREALKDSAEAFDKYKLDASLKIVEATEGAAKANERAAKAEAQAAEAKLALEKYKAPRRLTPHQRAQFVHILKEFSGTAFDISASDAETLDFALDIESVLTETGWDRKSWTESGNGIGLPGRPFRAGVVILSGVDIQIRDTTLSKARDALVNVLKHAGFEGVRGSFANVPQEYPNRNVMHIMVGTKP